jgi:hypothetical protein
MHPQYDSPAKRAKETRNTSQLDEVVPAKVRNFSKRSTTLALLATYEDKDINHRGRSWPATAIDIEKRLIQRF